MPSRRTSRPHDLSRLLTAQPGQKVGTATILSNEGAKLPGRKTGSRKPVAAPWGRFVGGDGETVVLAFSLPPRVLWPNGRANHYAKAKAIKAHKTAAWLAASDALEEIGGGWERASVAAAFFWPDLRRRDSDGATASLKSLIDGITKAGLIPDDDTAHLSHLPPTFGVDRSCPRVELTLRRLTFPASP